MTMDLTALSSTRVEVAFEEIWEGEPPNRTSRPDPSRVRAVYLGLSPKEWCSLAMREGEHYIGGCCGTTSAMQDVINGIFREGGYADGDALFSLGEYARQHPDGFEDTFTKVWPQERFDDTCKRWKALDPWEKIAVSWQAVRDKVRPYSHRVRVNAGGESPDREIAELYDALSTSRFSAFYAKAKGDPNKQEHGNEIVTRAKLLCGARRLIEVLKEDFTSFEGFAIVLKNDPQVVARNGYGMCLYATEAHARELVATWGKTETPYEKSRHGGEAATDRVHIRPVRVSVQEGLTFLDEPGGVG